MQDTDETREVIRGRRAHVKGDFTIKQDQLESKPSVSATCLALKQLGSPSHFLANRVLTVATSKELGNAY